MALNDRDEQSGAARLQFVNAALEQTWRRGWCSRPGLDPEELIAAAKHVTGLTDFGAQNGWRDRLACLSDALYREAALSPIGLTIAHGQLVAALASRLRAAALWRRHPEIASVRLAAPIIVVGQMRSGSTRMQRLLACDRRFTFTRFFESWNPVSRWSGLPLDDRKLRGWLALTVAKWLNPRFGVIHPVRTLQADEEIGLHNIALFGSAFEAQWRIPSFAQRGEQMDTGPIYAEFRRHLQTIKWLRGDPSDKPWILKLPQFSQDLGTVLRTFPDARLIVLDRDPSHIVGSSASLVHNQMAVQSHRVDRAWIGQEWLRKVALRQRRTAAARRRHDGPAVDVAFDDMQADWRAQLGRVYAMLNVPLTAEAERAMANYLAKRRHRKLRRHRYDLADYGLCRDQIEAALGSAALTRSVAA